MGQKIGRRPQTQLCGAASNPFISAALAPAQSASSGTRRTLPSAMYARSVSSGKYICEPPDYRRSSMSMRLNPSGYSRMTMSSSPALSESWAFSHISGIIGTEVRKMLERGKMERGVFEIVDTESLVPPKHLLRKIDAAVDFTRIYDMVEPLYCLDNGRPSTDPVVLFKMVLIQHLYGLPSLRRTAEEVSANMCYRWFLGYRLQEETPHFSTISYNFRHRFTTETVDEIFAWILSEIAEAGYLSPSVVFVDGTHSTYSAWK